MEHTMLRLEQVVLAGAITGEEAGDEKITFTADVANAPVITDESLTDLSAMGIASMRQASPGVASLGIPADIFPLTAIFTIGVPQEDGVFLACLCHFLINIL